MHELPGFQLYLQLYREQYVLLLERAVAAGLAKTIADLLVTETFVCLYEEPALLNDKEKATSFLITTLDAFILTYLLGSIDSLPPSHAEISRLFASGIHERVIAAQMNVALSIVIRRLSFSLFLLKTQFAKKPKAPV